MLRDSPLPRSLRPPTEGRRDEGFPVTNRLTIRRPDDWHLHLRDTPFLEAVVSDTARQFARAIIMPNLNPPVRTCEDAMAYRSRILNALPAGSSFEPLMTLYLTDNTRVLLHQATSCQHR